MVKCRLPPAFRVPGCYAPPPGEQIGLPSAMAATSTRETSGDGPGTQSTSLLILIAAPFNSGQ